MKKVLKFVASLLTVSLLLALLVDLPKSPTELKAQPQRIRYDAGCNESTKVFTIDFTDNIGSDHFTAYNLMYWINSTASGSCRVWHYWNGNLVTRDSGLVLFPLDAPYVSPYNGTIMFDSLQVRKASASDVFCWEVTQW